MESVEYFEQEILPSPTSDEIEEMWQCFMHQEIERNKNLISVMEDAEELDRLFQENAIILSKMEKVRDSSGEYFCEEDQAIYESLQKDILLPIIERMKELGEFYWIRFNDNFVKHH